MDLLHYKKKGKITVCLFNFTCASASPLKKQVSTAVVRSSWMDGVFSHTDNLTLEELFTADMLTSRHRKGKVDLITFNDGSKCPSKGSK